MDGSSHVESSMVDLPNNILLDQSGYGKNDSLKGTIFGESMVEHSPPANNPVNNPKSLGSDHQYMFLSPKGMKDN